MGDIANGRMEMMRKGFHGKAEARRRCRNVGSFDCHVRDPSYRLSGDNVSISTLSQSLEGFRRRAMARGWVSMSRSRTDS
jgi:hypothetical protein